MSELECLIDPETARKELIESHELPPDQWIKEVIDRRIAKHTVRALIRIAEGPEEQDFWQLYQEERIKDGMNPIGSLALR